ncbi:DNA repair protein RecO (recombination protein O) [Sphingomonas vulcanisoli]|uniref:DNA repair protein RecO n=1 Tax=Sphingomonas vulcanisoli TaxID=1658060 RepID=A0ABX0TPJ4_9SPHN|nr:DNA repair protein RecO [Sphingomonas vulcanisoli]NIJ07023.1 DNA repair protein RecO (recombination protein O) [Sphingomonas vulcanisoli]
MHIETQAIVCAVRAHGEHGAIVRALTAETGLIAGYVRGGRSRRLKPVLVPGNLVRGDWRARTDEQLPALTVELIESRAALLGEALPAAAIDWGTALAAVALPEGQAYPRLYAALDGVLAAVAAAPAARGWATALVRYELLMLAELGFGLDLSGCVAGGEGALAFVSPKNGGAVSAAAGAPYRDRLLPLPSFLIEGGSADWPDVLDGLKLTGTFLERDLLHGRAADILAARERLVERIRRVGT